MSTCRASSVTASSSSSPPPPPPPPPHLVASKHDAKCRRVPRIISRRFYAYRQPQPRSPPFQQPPPASAHPAPSHPDFSLGALDLPCLEETILRFLVKYSKNRSYSADSDPLVQLRSEMNKSAFFNHCLMKRRYSVPETVMRKHKLQEALSKKSSTSSRKAQTSCAADPDALDDTPEASPGQVKDESCQTEVFYDYGTNRLRCHNSCKRTSRSRKRDNLRYFKKTNSYCQYKSLSMFHKRMSNRSRDSADAELGDGDIDADRLHGANLGTGHRGVKVPASATPGTACRRVKKSNSDKALSATRRLNPIARQHSYPPVGCASKGSSDDLDLMKIASMRPNLLIRPKIVLAGHEPLTRVPRKAFLDFGKSIDQNTSGYNTVCGSLDDTPRRRTPETPKLSTGGREQPANGQPPTEEKKFGSFPITFHSESVFVHPYENGFLSHKELHHISIQLVPDTKLEETSEATKDYFKTEVKVGVPQTGAARSQAPPERMQTKIEAAAKALSDISENSLDKDERSRQSVPLVQEPETPRDSDDCTVPVGNALFKTDQDGAAKLRIEVEVPTLDLSKSSAMQRILSSTDHIPPETLQDQPDTEPDIHTSANQKPPPDKYPTKATLNYLFQKLGDTYPKRQLLKQPTFPDYSPQQGRYYSDLFKGDCLQIPHKVHFNNQTYDILSANLLPNEWSSTISTASYPQPYPDEDLPFPRLSPPNAIIPDDALAEPLSDSDISIADSLEDFQHQLTKPATNKYSKYDSRLARGDVSYAKPSSQPQNRGNHGISYFLPLDEAATPAKAGMPIALRDKLRSRDSRLSRHTLCADTKHKKTLKRGRLCHKQIQTSLNGDTTKSKIKAIAPKAEPQLPNGDESDLDERIMDILLKGLKMQESPPSAAETSSTRSAPANSLSPEGQPVVSEYVEMYRLTAPIDPCESSANGRLFHSAEPSVAADMFEVLQSEEEIGRINATDYYKSVKKSRRIYYPIKGQPLPKNGCASNCGTSSSSIPQPSYGVPTFSKYQKKLREFRHQIRRHNLDKINPLQAGNGVDTSGTTCPPEAGLPQQVKIKKMLRDKHKIKNHNCKIPGIRFNRFHQRFEAIPEEMGASSTEQLEPNQEGRTGDGQTKAAAGLITVDINKNVESDGKGDLSKLDVVGQKGAEGRIQESQEPSLLEEAVEKNELQGAEYTDELKSQKGRNSLSVVREQEELITLSRGWINFYLLNGNNMDDYETAEQFEDENISLSETARIPQQYSVHIHAKPQNGSEHAPKTSSLPGLCKSSPGLSTRNGKLRAADKTVLPDIGHSSRHKVINANLRNLRSKNALPKLHPSDESDASRKAEVELTPAEPVTGQDICIKEMPISGTVTSSIHSESSADEVSDRDRIKKFQRYHRPHTYHATRTNNQWSLTIEGNHGEKQASDIEMQLFVKNKNNGNSNQTWKFSIKNEKAGQTQGYDRHVRTNYLPHLNVNYKMLPFPIYHDDSASYSENNSRSNSALSGRNVRGANIIKDTSRNLKKFNGDMRLQIRQSDDDLTVTGSAITPERKPKVPTMSERDLHRMKLLRQTSIENKTT